MSFGVLLNNRLITMLRQGGEILLEPWDPANLQVAQYALNPSEVLYEDNEGKETIHNLRTSPYIFRPGEYAKVIIDQKIILSDGVVGRFIAASGLIEAGFGLTVGKLDPAYGQQRETIQFGIKNLRDRANPLDRTGKFTSRVAYVEFFDIRSLPAESAELREYDYEVRQKRRFRSEFAQNGLPEEY